MDTIRLHDKTFRRSISCEQLQKAFAEVAARINSDYREKRTPLFVGVLNGSFMFMGELLRHISFDCEVSFVKIASYSGTATTGRVRELIGLSQDIRGRHVILVEDIVDTGASIEYMTGVLKKQGPADIAVATLLFKPECYRKQTPPKYYALSIPDKFIVGFGLDYDQLGRNYKDIYEIADDHE